MRALQVQHKLLMSYVMILQTESVASCRNRLTSEKHLAPLRPLDFKTVTIRQTAVDMIHCDNTRLGIFHNN